MTTDLRVIKTKRAIRQGFLACVQAKPFSSVTNKDLTTAMQINKSTFYHYYQDKYDLREHVIDGALAHFASVVDVSYINLAPIELVQYERELPAALRPIHENRQELLTFWSPNMESNVFDRMQQIFVDKVLNVLQSAHPNSPENPYDLLHARLFASSAMQVVKWWLEVTPTTTPAEVATLIVTHLKSGMYHGDLRP
ncbi:TetR/AcrR family transcriptional regulator [Lacticaseibacillus songhuajiangensis]|uniref:TetR/AcrR family transcriptional regulator n=1 Tax=Lacticaseibacillus songhuajiangensis TaxID=1296539 RepID=UPI0013DE2755|nr:TetR/AcrR family transcriptional regulator [Lacticaseibacillus songhuajiangensis]